jgi:transcriptional regulator with XRE-family HTH domain
MRELAERAGITEFTLSKVERGDLTVGLGVAFEAAALVGVPLFHEDPSRTTIDIDRARDRLALLPRRARARKEGVKDDF